MNQHPISIPEIRSNAGIYRVLFSDERINFQVERRERARRLRLRLVALKRHAAARGPDGKSALAVAAGKASRAQTDRRLRLRARDGDPSLVSPGR